ncbi:uncharacterized protein LOC127653362 isoform X1 [Xyrauchen texanus]|uniref:uncharacterized protein LOC127653362 isoform X1 n=1 Tax=Xyrauchen texanus TaxID=154827 RepID=UPI0022423C05|nr:uncharacterized protein LOC127653362 isoform X1 [Xyrauchen texanus]
MVDFREEFGQEHSKLSGSSSFNASPMQQTSTPVNASPVKYTTPEKVVKLSFPEYVLHTNTELEQVRQQYFELSKRGEQRNCQMSKELRCRLIRNTMTSMIAILRAKVDAESHRYPSKPEITAMAKRMVLYYPMLQDQGLHTWLYKRLQNVRSPQKRTPDGRHSKSSTKRRCLEQATDTDEIDSSDSTVILDRSTEGSGSPSSDSKESELEEKRRSQSLPEDAPSALSSPDANNSAGVDSPDTSPATLAKHYKTLQTLYKRKNPNHQDVSHLLDLEFVARRAFIDSNTVREEDRQEKVLEAYPCFKDVGHVMEELQRILDKDNTNFIDELKGRWHDFCQNVQFFGVWKKALKPPMGMDKADQALEILRVLPSLFPSTSAPPKRVRDASEALVHVLEGTEDPNSYLKKRPLSCPVLIVGPSNCLLAVGDVAITTFPKEKLTESALYLMAYYYTLHLTYPKCVATLLSVIQTEVLLDKIHERDLTSSYKKSMAEWKAFIGQ